MLVHEHEGGAVDDAGDPEPLSDALGQLCLARAELSVQEDNASRSQTASQ